MGHPPPLIASIVTRHFGNGRARPVIVEEYSAETGWNRPASGKRILDQAAVDELRDRGITLVRARWRLHTREFSVIRLHEEHHPPSAERTLPAGAAVEGTSMPDPSEGPTDVPHSTEGTHS